MRVATAELRVLCKMYKDLRHNKQFQGRVCRLQPRAVLPLRWPPPAPASVPAGPAHFLLEKHTTAKRINCISLLATAQRKQ